MDLGQLNHLVVLVKEGCQYCEGVKAIITDLVQKKVIRPDQYTIVDVNKGSPENRKRFTDAFASVPQIFIAGKHVPGGYSNFENMHKSGELARRLHQ